MSSENWDKWIEIEAKALRKNLYALRTYMKDDVILMAVVKNNAYGQGMVENALLLAQEGVTHFAVTWVGEALTLRAAGISGEILLLAPVREDSSLEQAIQHRITLCVGTVDDLRKAGEVCRRLQTTAQVHLKIETGLSRFGFLGTEDLQAAAAVFRAFPELQPAGAFTHMADPMNEAFTRQQFRRFQQAVHTLRKAGIHPHCLHCAGSSVFLRYPDMHLNMVRLGTLLLCGQCPAGMTAPQLKLCDPYHYKTRVLSVRTLPAGSFLGYERTWRLRHPAQIAVLPVGYSDGLAVQIANRPHSLLDFGKRWLKAALSYSGWARWQLQVRINGQLYPVRGKVFMQVALVELPLQAAIAPGSIVEVFINRNLVRREIPRLLVEDTPQPAQGEK